MEMLTELGARGIVETYVPTFFLPIFVFLIFAILFFFLGKYVYRWVDRLIVFAEARMKDLPAGDILWGVAGLVIGMVLAYLVSIPVYRLDIAFIGSLLSLFIYIIFGILGIRIMLFKREEIATSLKNFISAKEMPKLKSGERKAAMAKILDSSVIIDGRISDILALGFLEGPIVVPTFVVAELQLIADSADGMKRTRGRKGLDAIRKMQEDDKLEIVVSERDYPEAHDVDAKLLKMAKEVKGMVVTNDYNLNKVAAVQGIPVLNINALANALKPVFVTGEKIRVSVVKPGSQDKQGLGYLDDGTMIVVENGIDYLGKEIDCIVTSMLQTSAGKMIFAKPAHQ
ncbi:uncharacterized protein YacL [Peptoniphilus ivorii]|nr:PIN domain-containing protein [Peptoniphilus ivorii]MDQ0508132.1 uncharacterized protein YacL [Peptoniphilus ivorii]